MALTQWCGYKAHVLPGRIRVWLPHMRGNPAFARRLTDTLGEIPGLYCASAIPVTGSLLFSYNPAVVTPEVIAGRIRLVGPSPPPSATPALRQATRQAVLTGAALGAVTIKRLFAGPSALSRSWVSYDLAGIVTMAATYPFLRRGVTTFFRHGRVDGDLLMGAAGLAATLMRENIIGLGALFITSLGHLLFARTLADCHGYVDGCIARQTLRAPRPGESTIPLTNGRKGPRHDTAIADRFEKHAFHWGMWAAGAAILTGLVTGDWRRALSTVIAAAPGAAALSATLPLYAGTAAAARQGMLAKGAEAIAAAGQVDTVLFAVTDEARPQARDAITALDIQVVQAGATPEDKAALVMSLQSAGHTVALVGDGANDCLALAAADLGLAVGNRDPLVLRSADTIILDGDPRKVAQFLHLGRRAHRIADQSKTLTVALNAVGLGLGATGAMGPLGASLWHNLTSLAILINALRLLPR